ICHRPHARSGIEERKRRTADSLAGATPATPRLRNLQADRTAFERGAALQCGLALPVALPVGKTGLDLWALGGKSGAKTAAFLSPDGRGPKSSAPASAGLAGLRRSHQSDNRAGTCVTGNQKSQRNLKP